jgi:hypothetical protein
MCPRPVGWTGAIESPGQGRKKRVFCAGNTLFFVFSCLALIRLGSTLFSHSGSKQENSYKSSHAVNKHITDLTTPAGYEDLV